MIKLKDILLESIDSPAFKQWFKNSKIVDSEGNPLRVYHGTDKYFTSFRLSREGVLGKGIYLTPDPKRASGYSTDSAFGDTRTDGTNVIPLYASIKNPLVVKDDENGRNPSVAALVALGVDRKKALAIVEKAFEQKGNLHSQIYKRAIDQGYDGIVVYRGDELFEVVAFDPRQVKSAISNTDYSPYKTDITKQ